MKTATRFDTWDAPDHWRAQHEDYRTRRQRADADRARMRRDVKDTGLT
ncbi:hypothetical protein [Nioella aestuarii]